MAQVTLTDLKLMQASLLNNPNIIAKVKANQSFAVTVKQLKENLADFPPCLGVLPEDLIVFRFLIIDEILQGMTLKLYIDDEDEQIKIFDAGEPPMPVNVQLKYIKYKTGLSGYQYAQVSADLGGGVISLPISLNGEYEKNLKESGYDPSLIEEGKGLIPPNFLKYRPRPTVKVRDLKEKTVYRVLARVGESQAYGKPTVRYSVQEVNGDLLLGDPFEMYANTSLNILIERQGIPLEVVVIDKKPNEKGEGTIVKFGLPELTRLKI